MLAITLFSYFSEAMQSFLGMGLAGIQLGTLELESPAEWVDTEGSSAQSCSFHQGGVGGVGVLKGGVAISAVRTGEVLCLSCVGRNVFTPFYSW